MVYQDLNAPVTVDTTASGTSTSPFSALGAPNSLLGSLGNVGSSIASDVPGLKEITSIIGVLAELGPKLGAVVKDIESDDILGTLTALVQRFGDFHSFFDAVISGSWSELTSLSGGTLFKTYLQDGLNLDMAQLQKDSGSGVQSVDDMLNFALGVTFICSAVGSVLDVLLGGRAPKAVTDLLGEIPQTMGLTWALGMQIDRSFETAIGASIDEGILYQKRPTRLEWRVVKQLFKQHIITDQKQAKDLIAYLGYREKDLELLMKLDEFSIPLVELARMLEYGMVGRDEIVTALKGQGYNDTEAEQLATLYVDHMETQTGTMYRSTARELFRAQLIDEASYRQILTQTNTPPLEISDDIAAIQLEHSHGRLNTSLSVLKTQYQHGAMTGAEVTPKLALLGYSPSAITDLLKAWDEGPLPHGMTTAKVLSYWYSKVITDRTTAFNHLIQNHLRPEDANFLLDHPTAAGAKLHALTPGLVTQAYLDGAITETGLEAALIAAKLSGDALTYQIDVAKFKKSRLKRPPGATVNLTAGEIREAFKFGLIDQVAAVLELEHLGYSADDALTLIEITNKGTITPPQPPAFPSVDLAIAFLESEGFKIFGPPDPRIGEAEATVVAAGYSYQPPITAPPAPL